jgi:hypothetical protein
VDRGLARRSREQRDSRARAKSKRSRASAESRRVWIAGLPAGVAKQREQPGEREEGG